MDNIPDATENDVDLNRDSSYISPTYLAMNKIQTYKLGLRYKQLKSCFAEAKKQELLQPGSLLVSGWTVVEVREKSYIRSTIRIC